VLSIIGSRASNDPGAVRLRMQRPRVEQRDTYALKVLDIAGNESQSERLGRGSDESTHRTERQADFLTPRHDNTPSPGKRLL
jgi:hypothetical protein